MWLPPPQVKTEISVESKHQTLQGLAFPLQPEAQRALQQLKQKTVNYIQLVSTLRPGTVGFFCFCLCVAQPHLYLLNRSASPCCS